MQGKSQNPERIIAFELVIAITVYIGVSLYQKEVPRPRVMAALLAVYAILGVVTIFGPQWGRVAYRFGGLVILGALFNKQVSAVVAKVNGGKGPVGPVGPIAAGAQTVSLIQTAAMTL